MVIRTIMGTAAEREDEGHDGRDRNVGDGGGVDNHKYLLDTKTDKAEDGHDSNDGGDDNSRGSACRHHRG